MNRTALIVIGSIVAIAIGGGVIWLVATSIAPKAQTTEATPTAPDMLGMNPPVSTPSTDTLPATDSPLAETASVTIKDMAYSPAKVTIKKGGTVTWTNQDSTGHDVVSDGTAPAGGPPKTNQLLAKGGTYSFTFNTVGTFTYHCTPHPFMHGTVEVVE